MVICDSTVDCKECGGGCGGNTPIELLNEDGTLFGSNFPKNPLEDKWNEMYPPNQRFKERTNCEGYSCMYCGLCPKGKYWEVPKEDKKQWEKYRKQVMEYHKEHNPRIYAILKCRNL